MNRAPTIALDANEVRKDFEQAVTHGLTGVPRVHPGATQRQENGAYCNWEIQCAWLGYLERASQQHARAQAPLNEGDRTEVRAILIRHLIDGNVSDDASIDKLIRAILKHFGGMPV